MPMRSVPERLERLGDPLEAMEGQAGSLDGLLRWVEGAPVRGGPSRQRRA